MHKYNTSFNDLYKFKHWNLLSVFSSVPPVQCVHIVCEFLTAYTWCHACLSWFLCNRYISCALKIAFLDDFSSRNQSALHKAPKPLEQSHKSLKGHVKTVCVCGPVYVKDWLQFLALWNKGSFNNHNWFDNHSATSEVPKGLLSEH